MDAYGHYQNTHDNIGSEFISNGDSTWIPTDDNRQNIISIIEARIASKEGWVELMENVKYELSPDDPYFREVHARAMFEQGNYEEVQEILGTGPIFPVEFHKRLQYLYRESQYEQSARNKNKPELCAVDKLRIRRKYPLPRTIWDGEERRYSIREKDRNILKRAFKNNPYPTSQEKRELMEITGLKPTQVTNWYKNRRQREKEKVLNESYNHNPYPTPEEKIRLSEETKLSLKKVDDWFEKRRQREEEKRLKSSYPGNSASSCSSSGPTQDDCCVDVGQEEVRSSDTMVTSSDMVQTGRYPQPQPSYDQSMMLPHYSNSAGIGPETYLSTYVSSFQQGYCHLPCCHSDPIVYTPSVNGVPFGQAYQ